MSQRHKHARNRGFHGGDLADAVAHAGHNESTEDWLDLSTGIAPRAYPLPVLEEAAWSRLPGRRDLNALKEAAATCYSAPSPVHLVVGPGSQALLQLLPQCLPSKPVTLLGPIYTGHASSWAAAKIETREVKSLAECDPSGITVLVNPNNPDGRVVPSDQLASFADDATHKEGWLVVDEAFADLDPSLSSTASTANRNVVVIRSFGKFFGLAGLRLGFAIAPATIAQHLETLLGPWAVSGPALQVGTTALADTNWQARQRQSLAQDINRLDDLLASASLTIIGGADMFRLVSSPHATSLHEHLLERKIYARPFPDHKDWLRFGLPGNAGGWARLETAFADFAP